MGEAPNESEFLNIQFVQSTLLIAKEGFSGIGNKVSIKYAMPVKVNILKIKGPSSQDRLSCSHSGFLKTLDQSQRVSAKDHSHPPTPPIVTTGHWVVSETDYQPIV